MKKRKLYHALPHSMFSLAFIAHRGASKHAPENTMAAFQQALRQGALQIECDIAFSKDGIPFIFHDDSLERTTNGCGLIQDKTWLELQKLDAGLWFSAQFQSEKIPSLAQLLEWKQQYPDLVLNLEVKSIPISMIAQKMNLLSSMWKDHTNLIISSFQPEILQYLKITRDMMPRALLVERWSKKALFLAKSLDCQQLNIGNRIVRQTIVDSLHGEFQTSHAKIARQRCRCNFYR